MLMPIHDCIKITLENEYFKEKLTEYYKENRRLKEQLEDLLKKYNTPEQLSPKKIENSSQTTLNLDAGATPITTSVKSSCSVCNKSNKTIKSINKNNLNTINEPFDNDIFNKQNKVNYFSNFVHLFLLLYKKKEKIK